jgi:hypothetical protein
MLHVGCSQILHQCATKKNWTMATRGDPPAEVAAERSDQRYSIDVRIFLATIMMGMALSFGFGVGVGFGPGGVMMHDPQRHLDQNEPRHTYIEPPAQDIDPNTVHEHQPAGQHLLVDLKNVDKEFLNSEERLAAAIVEVIKEGGLTLLSYHCHALVPSGVSCVGVLLESHISLQSTYTS